MAPEREVSRRGQSLARRERLRRRADFRRCYRKGRRLHQSHLTLYFVDNRGERPRFGMTVSRKVGNAVVRVKLKRRFREIYRRWPQRKDLPSLDFVIHAKPSAGNATFEELERELSGSLRAVVETSRAARRRPRP